MITLLFNHLRRTFQTGMIAALAAFGFHAFVVKVFQAMTTGPEAAQAGLMGRMMPKWMQTAMGLEQPMTELSGFLTVVYQHPFMLAIIVAVPIAAASSLLAGEIERRTLALLLGRPLSRSRIVLSVAFVCAFWSAVAAAAAWGGTFAGVRWTGSAPPDFRMLGFVALNLYLLALASAGIALTVSSMVSEKSDAVGWCVTILLGMYVANFLVQIWPPAAPVGDYLLFRYYAPGKMLLTNTVSALNFQVLGAVAAAGLLVALIAFSRRNFSL